jgi:NADPH2:quinone reductase
MRAAILREYGGVPEIGAFDDPTVDVAEVRAAGLNPIDLRIASGQLDASRPPLPYVVGREGVGTIAGRRVYFDQTAAPYGSMAERAPVDAGALVDVPDGLEDGHALCYGIAGVAAWLALEGKAAVQPGETVLILGATGVVGSIAVQVARLLGAGRVIAAGRDKAALRRCVDELGADAIVRLEASGAALTADMRAAAGGDIDVVFDPLWGHPAEAALEALAFRGRLVNLGQSGGAMASFPSVSVRFRELSIIGHTNFAAPFEVRRAAMERMFAHAAAGELKASYEELPLAQIGDAWARQAQSPGVKLVLRP